MPANCSLDGRFGELRVLRIGGLSEWDILALMIEQKSNLVDGVHGC
jgi:hypothetical protein